MTKYEFTLILAGSPELTDDLCDALFAAGCDDATPSQSGGVTKTILHREAESLEAAIRSAIGHVEVTGCHVDRLEMDNVALADALKV